MRDLVFALVLFGAVVGTSCTTAQAASLSQDSSGNEIQFQQPPPAPIATELPATNPSGDLVIALVIAAALGVIAYAVWR